MRASRGGSPAIPPPSFTHTSSITLRTLSLIFLRGEGNEPPPSAAAF